MNDVTRLDGLDLGNGRQADAWIGIVDLRSQAILDGATGAHLYATGGSSLERWIDADPPQRKRFLRYLVECALPDGMNVRLKYRGRTEIIGRGVGNLGPSLQAGAMTTGDQERVSSCLLARTNANGATLEIDLLAPYRGFERPYDPKTFKVREAAYYGNLFVSPIEAFVWFPDRVAPRTCSGDGDCGVLQPVGAYARMIYHRADAGREWAGECFVTGTERSGVVNASEARYGADKLVALNFCTSAATGKTYRHVMTVLTR